METPLLVFTPTDFGLSDAYAGVMKGVALTINPNLHFIDLTHQIQAQDIAQGSFTLGVNHRYFPKDAIHVAVVDPGVGTARRSILLSTPWGRFVGPDNGLLSGVLSRYMDSVPLTSGIVKPPTKLSVVHLTDTKYWHHPVSNTFHGRDVFTPVAAHLSLGVPPEEMGETVDNLFYLPTPQPKHQQGIITGQVIYQDVYGNLVTNIASSDLPLGGHTEVRIGDHRISGISYTFNDPGRRDDVKLVALVGSHGYLEVAVPNGSAADTLGIIRGQHLQVVVVSG